jgi:hypothetical protein
VSSFRAPDSVLCAALALLFSSRAGAQPSSAPAPRDTEEQSTAASVAQRVIEIAASAGPSVVFGEPANPELSPSVSRWGALLSATVAYRSGYFITPSLEVGYAWLARGEAELPAGPWGEGGSLEQRLGAWLISPGISARIWRFRPRLGIGFAIVTQSFSFWDENNSSSQYPLASQLVVDFEGLDLDGIRLDLQAGLVHAAGAGLTLARFGIAAHFDIVTFDD